MKSFKIAEISDIHLGHPNTPTLHILANLRKAFPLGSETASLDMIVFAGDVFDSLLSLPDDIVFEIEMWIASFLRMCKEYDIVVRVLEGTPSHDWGQSILFKKINEIYQIECDCQYVSKLFIEKNKKFTMHFLYVPDEWRPDPDQTWKEVLTLLKENDIEKVDYAFMHGFFPHQLPSHLIPGAHDHERYLSITKKLIFIGHVHKFSNYERIYAAGSFDRIGHGEEEPKGHLRCTVSDNEHTVTFVENKDAMIYKTVNCSKLNSEQLIKKVDKLVSKLSFPAAVRLMSPKSEIASESLKYFKEKYPNIKWSLKLDSKSIKQTEEIMRRQIEHKTITVTQDNIRDIMSARLKEKNKDNVEGCMHVLEEVISGDKYRSH